MYSLDDLDVTKACEQQYEFEVRDESTGKGIGLFLTVIGGHAERITEFTKKSLNDRRMAEAMAAKRDPRGKEVRIVPIEEDLQFSTELVAMRIVGWRGIKEPYTPEGAVKLCTINPLIKEQVLAASDNLKNFPMTFSASSPSTSASQPG